MHRGAPINQSINLPPVNGSARRLPALPPYANHIHDETDDGPRYRDTGDRAGYDQSSRMVVANRNLPVDPDEEEQWMRSGGPSNRSDRRNPHLREPMLVARGAALALAGMSSEAYEGTYRPVGEGKSVRLPFSSRPVLRPAEDSRPVDRLIGQSLGLGRYADARIVGAARREIEEAYSLGEQEIDLAADSLAPLMQHVGMHDIRDINENSRSALLRPAENSSRQHDSRGGSQEDLLLVTTL
ncbi:Voltage-dependent L-type calcium channel subunit alpha [Caenorhabditis elegans]|nr:Voltage-dependent L-type calcium channel subunit alpha [Caenorhabditis elegans]CDM63561.1 Voltage-dependent L-type calcium channel subunit alpha [Caenorhabditis elegans]|eukprot:NP_001294195.1 Voltage-dependent L-type calcium channel subunit alpha [Caenorhabditis elegans]